MKKSIITTLSLMATILIIGSCGGGGSTSEKSTNETEQPETTQTPSEQPEAKPESKADPSTYDPKRGEGKFNESNVKLGALDAAMADKGKAIAATKCNSCHKQTDEKLVGPGWKGVTHRKTPHWIMNFITNPDPMISKDPELQAQLEICLVRMPNQNLNDEEARNILEYMRQNDEVK
ncbi:c-type cytochrome [Solitalea lacus]|uniref:c-type cytochrome n=1 Tax=Solitalea lacus TaxID=2911172 RepID=UPI001EDACA3F|nr:cytochrome c [Solitalea lacus]UKJ07971.1 cytochrome c [Solitalea lacus]